jgi:uncharacterized membrane protein
MVSKIWIGGVALVVLIAIAALGMSGPLTGNVAGKSGTIKISLSDVTEKAEWYKYDSNGVEVRYFAVKASDGSIKTGFDECDVCYRSGKGFRQEGDYMVCNNCGNRYPITGLGTENKNPGGCWPGFLPNSVQGDSVVIQKSDLEKNKWRFQ